LYTLSVDVELGLVLGEHRMPRMFENRGLRRKCGAKREKVVDRGMK
jgi:hypothetical protein